MATESEKPMASVAPPTTIPAPTAPLPSPPNATVPRTPAPPESFEPYVPPTCAHTTVFNSLRINLNRKCTVKAKLNVLDRDNIPTQLELCKEDEKQLDMEGAAFIEGTPTGEGYWLNWENHGKYRHLTDLQVKRCPFAFGSLDQNRKPICLDAMYSLAADIKFYKPGDVIFFPSLVGMPIPKDYQVLGPVHYGYFVVRDVGEMITGDDRFDLFSGFIHWSDEKNPFRQRGFTIKKRCTPFQKIVGEAADKVRARLNFPNSLYTEKISKILPPPPPKPRPSLPLSPPAGIIVTPAEGVAVPTTAPATVVTASPPVATLPIAKDSPSVGTPVSPALTTLPEPVKAAESQASIPSPVVVPAATSTAPVVEVETGSSVQNETEDDKEDKPAPSHRKKRKKRHRK